MPIEIKKESKETIIEKKVYGSIEVTFSKEGDYKKKNLR